MTGSVEAAASIEDPRVTAAVDRLEEIDGLSLGEQVDVFSDLHRRLSAVLADPSSQA